MVKKLKKEMTFREAFERMEELSRRLEETELDVEEGMALVQEAEKFHQFLQKKLREAKLIVKEKG
jgi:exodeoxyribonuclease VII small subunit